MSKPNPKRPLEPNWLLIFIVILALGLRLFGLTNSLTDWHSFRQADTASVTREYVKHGIDLLHPTYQDLGNIQSGKDNPKGYRMVEFPFINAFLALILRTVPSLDLVVISRLFSILCSLGTTVALYYLGKRWANPAVGYLSALTFASLPYAVYYSRVILPEPSFTFCVTFAVLAFDIWIEDHKKRWYLLSFISFALALLLKPFALFFAPVMGYLALRHYRERVFYQPLLYLYGLTLAPMIWWRTWIQQFPEGIPASDWLFNGDGIRLRPAWFRWLGWERYTKMILGGGNLVVLASLLKKDKMRELLIVWGSCVLLYLVVIATGNVRHDYYQSITLPVVALAVGQGLWVIYHFFHHRDWKWAGIGVTAALFITMVLISRQFVWGFYRTRPDWEQVGQAVDRLTPPDAKVIIPAMSDTAPLFQANRTGWTLGGDIDHKIEQGATYYASTAYDDEAKELERRFQLIEKNSNHIIIKLSP